MTSTTENTNSKLIHIARVKSSSGIWEYLFLRKLETNRFTWFLQTKQDSSIIETLVSGQTVEEAMRLAARHWKTDSFTNVNCGFRYTLPERDEHGINALFHQMAASSGSMNGVYYDEELGNNCFVQNASDEAFRLWRSGIK